MTKKFIWLSDPCVWRNGGPKLEKNKEYSISDFTAPVVAEWVKTKHAKYNDKKEEKK